METVQADEKFITQLIDAQPDALTWFVPVFEDPLSPDRVTDFVVRYCNTAAAMLLSAPKEAVIGTSLRTAAIMDEASRTRTFDQCARVWATGEPLEFTYHSEELDRYFNVQRSKTSGGILNITRDRTDLVRAQQEREHHSELLEKVMQIAPYGISIYEAMRDGNGKIVDFRLRMANRKSAEIVGFTLDELRLNTVKQLIAMRGPAADYFAVCVSVVESGKPFEITHYAKGLLRWISISIVKFEDGYLLNYIDVTHTKELERAAAEKAERLDAIFDALFNSIFAVEATRNDDGGITDFIFRDVNVPFEKFVGKPADVLVGKSMLTTFPTVGANGLFERYVNVLTSGEATRVEMYYDGEGIGAWIDVSAVRANLNTLVVTFADISEYRKTLSEVERQKNLLDNILHHTANGITVVEALRDHSGDITDWRPILANKAAERLSGIPLELILSKTAKQLDPSVPESPTSRAARKTLESGEPTIGLLHLESTGRWLEVSVSRLDNNHTINVFTDVTPMREAQKVLEESHAALKRSNANLEEFAHMASHDLQEPLRKISVFATQLRTGLEPALEAAQREKFDRIEKATDRMRALIDDLLEYSQVSRNEAPREQTNLADVVQNVLADLETVITEKQATVTVGALPVLPGNPSQLHRLFQNLVINALKYSKTDEAPVVSIEASRTTGESGKANWRIAVRDNGIGFEQTQAANIFNIFTRLHGKSQYGGTGVGLAIARKVAENHGGTIIASSEPGGGALFVVQLPE